MPEEMRVGNVQEAVELAQRLKDKGQYDWFRGQVRDWAPLSSLHRLYQRRDDVAVTRMKTRYGLFCQWLENNAALRHLLDDENADQFFAVAQHYGIPTHYIDFTTDPAVAGFFAADTLTPPPADDGFSCIYCLNTEELREVAETVGGLQGRRPIKTIEVDVTNLWRLQAQRGVFVFAEYNWDIDFPMDKILFPYGGYPAYPPKGNIYPREKSALELMLDQYFDFESKHFGQVELRKMFDTLKAAGVPASWHDAIAPTGGFHAEAFADPSAFTALPSWNRAHEADWQVYPSERFDDVGGPVERIRLTAPDRRSLEGAVRFAVEQALKAKPQNRAKLIEWTLEGAVGDLPVDRLSGLFRAAWNGMRSLPFSHVQIAAALAAIAGLVAANFDGQGDHAEFSDVRGDGLLVEFAYADNSSSRGFVNKEAARRAIRGDLARHVLPTHQDSLRDLTATLLLVPNPALLFDFEAFVDIFARDLIPSQLVLERKPTLFNPAAVALFGVP